MIVKWQEDNAVTYSEILEKPMFEQLLAVKKMFLKSKDGIKKMLKFPDKQDFLIDLAYERSFIKYLDYTQKQF